ncbi:uncharacterized protein LOC134601720 [Pelobates fuscus]|uniref:uncharacterized protein LOC134601720 n=1 Tax=Pelobates fuscus TaxID=191477 RepID=UPI002FE47FBE
MAERFAREKKQMFPALSRETTHGKASSIRVRPTQRNTSSGIKLPPYPNNRILMLTTNPSENVDFIRAPPAEQFVNVPSGVKFPVCSKKPVQFWTTKLSETLYKPSPSFDLGDPYCRLMKTTYNNLHDPYLKEYYQSKVPRQRILQQGFITSDDKVVCSLKEYNEYREYLSSIHRKKMKNVSWIQIYSKNSQHSRQSVIFSGMIFSYSN